MSLHVFGAVVTHFGVAANNRGESEGNITTLQKILWNGQIHTTVSAEAIRWAIRYYWQQQGTEVNRMWADEHEDHVWQDPNWKGWSSDSGKTYIDDDLLGYMKAEGGKTEGEKGRTDKRRGVLEVARAISLTPFAGDITFNAVSGEKGRTSLYGTEVHATRFQYGFAMTPSRLRVQSRALDAIKAITNLGEVAGNHSRFLFDFSPESIVLRITDDPAPRLLYCFQQTEDEKVGVPELVRRVSVEDISASELYIGGAVAESPEVRDLSEANVYPGVKEAEAEFLSELQTRLQKKE
jgi:CRISPR-associated protein Cst2